MINIRLRLIQLLIIFLELTSEKNTLFDYAVFFPEDKFEYNYIAFILVLNMILSNVIFITLMVSVVLFVIH